MQAVEAARPDAPGYRVLRQPEGHKLVKRNHPVLAAGQSRDGHTD